MMIRLCSMLPSDGEIFKQKLVLHRELVCSKKENKLQINDTVLANRAPCLFYIKANLGYPLLDENAAGNHCG